MARFRSYGLPTSDPAGRWFWLALGSGLLALLLAALALWG